MPDTKTDADFPFRLTLTQRVHMYLHEWRGRHCSRQIVPPGMTPVGKCCDGGCDLPSIGKIEIYTNVKRGTVALARKSFACDPRFACAALQPGKLESPPNDPLICEDGDCAENPTCE